MAEEKDKMAVNEEEIGKDKHLSLRFFCIALELIGWILIFVGIMWFIYSMSAGGKRASENINEIKTILEIISWFISDFAFLGLLAVILAHLARYIFDRDFHRGVLLHCGDKILYLFAIFTVAWAIFSWFYYLLSKEYRRFELANFTCPAFATTNHCKGVGSCMSRPDIKTNSAYY